jgi:hypothetical protein
MAPLCCRTTLCRTSWPSSCSRGRLTMCPTGRTAWRAPPTRTPPLHASTASSAAPAGTSPSRSSTRTITTSTTSTRPCPFTGAPPHTRTRTHTHRERERDGVAGKPRPHPRTALCAHAAGQVCVNLAAAPRRVSAGWHARGAAVRRGDALAMTCTHSARSPQPRLWGSALYIRG